MGPTIDVPVESVAGRDVIGRLVRAILVLYLSPVILATLAVGVLAMAAIGIALMLADAFQIARAWARRRAAGVAPASPLATRGGRPGR
jgi:hypothetical protein